MNSPQLNILHKCRETILCKPDNSPFTCHLFVHL